LKSYFYFLVIPTNDGWGWLIKTYGSGFSTLNNTNTGQPHPKDPSPTLRNSIWIPSLLMTILSYQAQRKFLNYSKRKK